MSKRSKELSYAELEAAIETLTRKLERLRSTYEKYFIGVERRPPQTLRKEVVRELNLLMHMKIQNTALRFRLQQQQQKFTTHSAYWNRTLREIENGTYHKHKARVKHREKKRVAQGELTATDVAQVNAIRDRLGDEAAEEAMKKRTAQTEAGKAAESFLQELGFAPTPKKPKETSPIAKKEVKKEPEKESKKPKNSSVLTMRERLQLLRTKIKENNQSKLGDSSSSSPTTRPTVPKRTTNPKRTTKKRAIPPSIPTRKPRPKNDEASTVYRKLIAAKRRLNEPTSKLSEVGLRKSLAAQRKKMLAKHKCKDVSFDVVVRKGKAYLKPTPIFE